MTDTTTATTTTTATLGAVQEVPMATLLPEWTNRRKVIFWSLRFCGGVVGVIVLSTCIAVFLNLFRVGVAIDTNLIQLLTTIVYTAAFVSTSIIGSYVFGANFDYANSRAHVTNSITQSSSVKSEPSS